MTTVVQTYTKVQLDRIKYHMGILYRTMAATAAKRINFGMTFSQKKKLQKVFLYRWVINQWNQNQNGSTDYQTNLITQTQLTDIINDLKQQY